MERAFSYNVVTPPANLPISLALLKTQLKLDPSDTSQDDYLTLIIESARDTAEQLTKRTLINTEFLTYRDVFSCNIELRRSKFQSLTSFKYLKDSVLTTVDSSLYYLTNQTAFSSIILNSDKEYPTDIDFRFQAIEIVFVAGYGATDSTVPSKLKMAMLNHAAYLYENRGDCDVTAVDDVMKALPNSSRQIYWDMRIRDFGNFCDNWNWNTQYNNFY